MGLFAFSLPLVLSVAQWPYFVGSCNPQLLANVGCPSNEFHVDWEAFLETACKVCPRPGEPCHMDEELFSYSRIVFEKLEMSSLKCERGVLSAVLYVSQFNDISHMEDSLLEKLQQATDLTPFPFNTGSFALYTSMLPAIQSFCSENERSENRYKFVPRADVSRARCGMRHTDSQLVRICRSRQKLFPKPDNHTAERRALLDNLQSSCPTQPDNTGIVGAIQTLNLNKYVERASAEGNQCSSRKGMWREAMNDEHKCVLISVGHALGYRPGDLVLDWGSGCGHKLSWAKSFFDVDGFGVDIVGDAVEWARKYSVGRFCEADGRDLSFIPDETFDFVFTFAAIYHVSPLEDQCFVGRQLMRKLKVGGKAFFGWNRANVYTAWGWRECFREAKLLGEVNVQLEAVEDAFMFPEDDLAANASYLFMSPAYSMFLTRLPLPQDMLELNLF